MGRRRHHRTGGLQSTPHRLLELPGRTAVASLAVLVLLGAPVALAGPRPMHFEQLSIDQGLSQSVVNCMLQDRTGFLWFGTQGGLNRYDGYGFKVYRHDADDPTTLGHDWVLALAEDPSGDLWVGTEGGGLSRWHRESDSFSTYRHDPGDPGSLSGDRIVGLARDRTGGPTSRALWIATLASGLNRYDPASGTFERFRHDPGDPDSLSHDQTGAVFVDREGKVWVGTWGGLDLYDPLLERPESRSFTHWRHDPGDPKSLSDNRVRAIFEDRESRLWIGTHHGLNRLDPLPGRQAREQPLPERRRGGTMERFLHDAADPGSLSHDWVRALYQDRDGRLWVGTDGGLNLWQETTGSFVRYHPDPADPRSLGGNQVLALAQDRSGVLWVSTFGTGVNKWNPASWSFAHYRSSAAGDGATTDTVFALAEDRQGGVWVGTFGGGLERLDRASGDRRRYTHDPADPQSLADDRVTALLHDRDDALWVGTVGGGLQRLDPLPGRAATGRFEPFRHDPQRDDSLSRDAVTALHQDRRGRLWVGTWRGGLNLYRGGDAFLRLQHDPEDPQSLGDDQVFGLAEDAIGRLWVATDGGGLNRLDPRTLAFLRLRHDAADPESLASDELLSVHVDGNHRLWAGTKGSGLDRLVHLDDATGEAVFKNYSAADGLPDETVWALTSDAAGSLWIATNRGLAHLDPEAETFRNYDTSHGLQSNEFNQGAVFRSPSGELFFGGVNGWNAFYPDQVRGAAEPPTMVLTAFTRFNQPAPLGRPLEGVERLELSYRDHYLAFEFAALDFTAPERNRYRYRIAGLDDAWIDLGTERRVTFASLEPGRYTLKVQGSNHDGVWNEEGAAIDIVVAAPLWATWWAWGLYLVSAVGLIGGLIRAQQRKIARQRAHLVERERLLRQRELLIDELESKNAELERFNYTVSHDLKTPLVTIKGFLGLLRKDAAAVAAGRGSLERLDHDVRRIAAAADRMSKLLEELLEYSRVGRQVNPPERVSLFELAAEAVEMMAGLLQKRKVTIDISPDLPVVLGDRIRLLEVLQNLLDNAVKYMGDQRSPRIEVGVRPGAGGPAPRVPGASSEPPLPVVTVRDNGLGIDPRYHQLVFGLFERLDATDEGTGVGLALAQRIVELHGGRIWVESEGIGCGSTFCFTLGRGPAYRLGDGGDSATRTESEAGGDRLGEPALLVTSV